MAATVAVATPCWPAPVSAMTRVLPMRRARSTWPDGIVDFVRAGVEQILALEINFRAAQFACEPFGKIKRRGPSAKLAQIIIQFRLKFQVLLGAIILLLQLLQGIHQRLRHVTPAIGTETSAGIGQIALRNCNHDWKMRMIVMVGNYYPPSPPARRQIMLTVMGSDGCDGKGRAGSPLPAVGHRQKK